MIVIRKYTNVRELTNDINSLVNTLTSPHLIELVNFFVKDERFYNKPASKTHHKESWGLAEHALQTAYCALNIMEMYKSYDVLSRDLLVAGGLLHDIGKMNILPGSPHIEGSMSHSIIGATMVYNKMAEMGVFTKWQMSELSSIMLCHHTEIDDETARPDIYETIEAYIIRLADTLSAVPSAAFPSLREHHKIDCLYGQTNIKRSSFAYETDF